MENITVNFASLLNAMPGAVAQGMIWGIMAIGLYITYRILEFSDLTVDGSIATGGAVAAMLIINGWSVWAALLAAFVVGMLYCSAEPNSIYQVEEVTAHLQALGITVSEYAFADSNDVASVAQLAADEVDVIYIPTDNTAAAYAETIANVVLPAQIPVIAGEAGICAGCGVATLSISYYDLGCATAEMAYEILVNGADPAAMEVQYAPQFTKMYNALIADELGVTIPADYIVIE